MDKSSAATQFELHPQARRKELWGILDDLPWRHQPAPPQFVKTEKHEGYTLERLVLDLNGLEPVPAILLILVQDRHHRDLLVMVHADKIQLRTSF